MKHFLLSLFAVVLSVSLVGCLGGKNKYTDYSFESFDTVTTIIGYEKSKDDFDAVCSEIKSLLTKYHRLFDIYNEYEGINNLCTINATENGKHKRVETDEEIIELIEFSKKIYDISDGRVNIAMGSVLSIWHDYRERGLENPENASLPPIDLLKEAKSHTDIKNVITDKKEKTVFLADSLMTLDVGAVAKGYAIEKVAEHLEKNGVSGYLINVGGNVRAVGKKADKTLWTVGVENPDKTSSKAYVSQEVLRDEAIATSGSYQRFYTVGDKNYHHIIDDETLMPGENFLSVSVICDDAAMADGLSTALFLKTFDEGIELLKNFSSARAVWVFPDGSIREWNG